MTKRFELTMQFYISKQPLQGFSFDRLHQVGVRGQVQRRCHVQVHGPPQGGHRQQGPWVCNLSGGAGGDVSVSKFN